MQREAAIVSGALGHPIGTTGASITVKALHELKRVNGRRTLVNMCIEVRVSRRFSKAQYSL